MPSLAALDQRYVWHPFTQMRDWLRRKPIVIVGGHGAELVDVNGRKFLDANSSIWTNLHGHNHPRINKAIRQQLRKIAHSSALGLANEPASVLAETLVLAANPAALHRTVPKLIESARKIGRRPLLGKVFFSDNGSTAIEVALKLAFEFARRTGLARKPGFLSLQGGYHGDTIGAVSLGHIDLFHKAYSPLLFKADKVMAPYCYRCPFNRAKPERLDARQYRKCNWECLDQLEQKFAVKLRRGEPYAGFIFEPLMQGAAGMIPQPDGWLKRACAIARGNGSLLIADEIMTGFGRTGCRQVSGYTPNTNVVAAREQREPAARSLTTPLFACHTEGVQPDFLALAKGLTGGYLPMAATLTSQKIFDVFLGDYEEFKTFFHGHSFTGNQIGAAAALANLKILQEPASIKARARLQRTLSKQLKQLWDHPQIGDIRQSGLVVGIELVKDWRTRESFDLREQAGIRVCEALARRGVLTRPIGNVIVIMPPYCTTETQLTRMITKLGQSIVETFGGKRVKTA